MGAMGGHPAGEAQAIYAWLAGAPPEGPQDEGARDDAAFDRHVFAAILALALAEGRTSGRPVLAGLGLSKAAAMEVVGALFPHARETLDAEIADVAGAVEHEEQQLRDILGMYCAARGRRERLLVQLIARRCASPHHLWQDLGLSNRAELSRLMRRHFPLLAQKNSGDMKWKKFLYRLVCGTEGFTLCTAPVCAECDDFAVCFGAEDGESRLAVARNGPVAEVLAAAAGRGAAG